MWPVSSSKQSVTCLILHTLCDLSRHPHNLWPFSSPTQFVIHFVTQTFCDLSHHRTVCDLSHHPHNLWHFSSSTLYVACPIIHAICDLSHHPHYLWPVSSSILSVTCLIIHSIYDPSHHPHHLRPISSSTAHVISFSHSRCTFSYTLFPHTHHIHSLTICHSHNSSRHPAFHTWPRHNIDSNNDNSSSSINCWNVSSSSTYLKIIYFFRHFLWTILQHSFWETITHCPCCLLTHIRRNFAGNYSLSSCSNNTLWKTRNHDP